MGRRLSELARMRPGALEGLVIYAACLALMLAVAGLLANYAANSAIQAADTELALERAQAERNPPRVSGSITGLWMKNQPVVVDTKPFTHDRVAPGFLEKVDPEDIATLKARVSERVVSDDPRLWQTTGAAPTYKTMCVRLCDGAYFPVSFSTTREHFVRDEAICASRCGAPSRLFVFRNPGATPEMMRDMNGRSYVAMPTAFQFRRGMVEGCSCQAQPWQTASRQRHQLYALEQQRAEGKTVNLSELQSLRKRYGTAGYIARLPAVSATIVARQTPENLAPAALVVPKEPFADHANARPAELLAAIEPSRSVTAFPLVPPLPVQRMRKLADATAATNDADMKSTLSVRNRSKKRLQKQLALAEQQQLPNQYFTRVVEKQIWGIGRNAYGRPRGDSAYAAFARNFY